MGSKHPSSSRITFADLRTPSLNVKCAVFRQETSSKELRFLKRRHNSFHGGTRTPFLDVFVEVSDIANAWKAHVLARNLKCDSFPRTGETWYARSHWEGVKKLHEGVLSNQCEAHHCHPEACFDELCAVLGKRVNFSASYNDNGIILENAHVLLTTLRFFD